MTKKKSTLPYSKNIINIWKCVLIWENILCVYSKTFIAVAWFGLVYMSSFIIRSMKCAVVIFFLCSSIEFGVLFIVDVRFVEYTRSCSHMVQDTRTHTLWNTTWKFSIFIHNAMRRDRIRMFISNFVTAKI